MKYCKNCGAGLSDEAMFCTNCGERTESGASIVGSEETSVVVDSSIKERNIALAIILTIITCGIYGIYWMVKLNDEGLKLAREDGPSGVVVILLTIITCGIYGYFWAYKMGVCTDKMRGNEYGYNGILFIIISAIGLGIVNYVLIQNAINQKVGK